MSCENQSKLVTLSATTLQEVFASEPISNMLPHSLPFLCHAISTTVPFGHLAVVCFGGLFGHVPENNCRRKRFLAPSQTVLPTYGSCGVVGEMERMECVSLDTNKNASVGTTRNWSTVNTETKNKRSGLTVFNPHSFPTLKQTRSIRF